jgi:O-antigen/teichoic acid export membrane protein
MATASVPLALAVVFNDLGISATLVQREALDDRFVRTLATISYLLGTCVGIAVFLSAPVVASFFNEPALVQIVQALAIVFPISSLCMVPDALLWRSMAFRRRAIIELIAAVGGALVTLLLALRESGVWALVSGVIASAVLRTAITLVSHGGIVPPTRQFGVGLETVRFGAWLFAEKLAFVVYSRTDVAVVGRILGAEQTGILSVANTIATLPVQKVNGTLNDLALPAFSRVGQTGKSLGNYLDTTIAWLALIACPVFFGISAVSEPLVKAVLGVKWTPAAPVLHLLALVVPLQMIANIVSMAMQSIARPKPTVGLLAGTAVCIAIGILMLSKAGLAGVALTWIVVYPITFVIYLLSVKRYVGFGPRDCARAIARPMACAGVMWVVVQVVAIWSERVASPMVDLVVRCALGAAVYAVLAWLCCRKEIEGLFGLLNGSVARSSSK